MDRQVRVAAPEDAAAVREIYAPFVVSTAVSFEEEPPTVPEMAERIASTIQEYPWLVCECDGTVAGYAAADALRSTGAYEWTVELSIYVAESARRSGIGRALYASLFEVLSLQGYRSAYAVTTLPNPPSTGFHEAMGFEPVGRFPNAGYKHGAWHDIQWWYRPVDDLPAELSPPTTLPQLRGEPELERALAVGERHLA